VFLTFAGNKLSAVRPSLIIRPLSVIRKLENNVFYYKILGFNKH